MAYGDLAAAPYSSCCYSLRFEIDMDCTNQQIYTAAALLLTYYVQNRSEEQKALKGLMAAYYHRLLMSD